MSGPVPVGVQASCSCCCEQPRAADNKAFLCLSATDLRAAAWLRSDFSLSNRNLLDHKSDLRVCWRVQKHDAVNVEGNHRRQKRASRSRQHGVVWEFVRGVLDMLGFKDACKTGPSYINIFLPKRLWDGKPVISTDMILFHIRLRNRDFCIILLTCRFACVVKDAWLDLYLKLKCVVAAKMYT